MTTHTLYVGNSNSMEQIEDKSVQLIVTSPPYPMIEMWDEMYSKQDISIKKSIDENCPNDAFLKMHAILNEIWSECDRVLADNGFICINIGDATRTFDGKFQLFSNHTQIINFFFE